MFGCGGDEDASKTLVRTWELVAIDGEPLKSDQQSDIGDVGPDTVNMAVKSVMEERRFIGENKLHVLMVVMRKLLPTGVSETTAWELIRLAWEFQSEV